MRCVIRWKSRSAAAPRCDRLARLDSALHQAAQTGYYRRNQIHLPPSAPRDDTLLPQCLGLIPPLNLSSFLANPADFYNWQHSPLLPRPLECPLANTGRTALLAEGFIETDNIRAFTYLNYDELEDFEPDSLAGPLPRLLSLAEAVLAGNIRLYSLRSTAIVFTGLKHGCLKQEHRDLLWRAFQVPVFQQFRGFSQELLAWECEAHDGLHIHSANAIFESPSRDGELLLTCLASPEYSLLRLSTEITARIVTTPCGCGDSSPRLLGLRSSLARRPHALIANA